MTIDTTPITTGNRNTLIADLNALAETLGAMRDTPFRAAQVEAELRGVGLDAGKCETAVDAASAHRDRALIHIQTAVTDMQAAVDALRAPIREARKAASQR